MATIAKLIDLARERAGIDSDLALASTFGVHRQAVSKWRNADAYPTQDHITKLAEMAGENAATWLVLVQAERESGPAGKAWAALAKRLAAAAACLLVAAGVTLPNEARAAEFAGLSASRDATGLYIMRYSRMWLRALFSRDFRWMPVPA